LVRLGFTHILGVIHLSGQIPRLDDIVVNELQCPYPFRAKARAIWLPTPPTPMRIIVERERAAWSNPGTASCAVVTDSSPFFLLKRLLR
jgi:hypothetical protein